MGEGVGENGHHVYFIYFTTYPHPEKGRGSRRPPGGGEVPNDFHPRMTYGTTPPPGGRRLPYHTKMKHHSVPHAQKPLKYTKYAVYTERAFHAAYIV